MTGLLYRTRNKAQLGDALAYILNSRSGLDSFHPHHLIFSPVLRLAHDAITLFLGPTADPLLPYQIFLIALHLVTIGIMYTLVYATTGKVWFSSLAAFTQLTANSLWGYATSAEVYGPVLTMIAGMTLVLHFAERMRPRSLRAFHFPQLSGPVPDISRRPSLADI